MLSHIYIKNIAIIREIDIDLQPGLNILSGETGTGKSIVIQAIELALGGRSSSSIIAENADKAIVQLVFSINDMERELLGRFADPEDDTVIFTRELSRSGRSLARINGEIVKLAELSAAASHLIDIHGQYDNQFFLDPKRHIDILDTYAGAEAAALKADLRTAYAQYNDIRSRLQEIRRDRGEFLRRLDFMKYELDEIEKANPLPNEDEELEDRMRLLSNGEKISSALSGTYEILYDSRIEQCVEMLQSIAGLDPEYGSLAASISECAYSLVDIREEVRRLRDDADFSPDELDSVMRRLDTLDTLKRKYGGSLASVLEHRDRCQEELGQALDSDEAEKQLTEQFKAARDEAMKIAEALSEVRKNAADHFAERMMAELSELSFSNAEFAAEFSVKETSTGQIRLTENGIDQMQFLFNSNKGSSLKPLSGVASGGEISRISLAFRNINADGDQIGTMIFDEIDTGISGRTASAAGVKMRRIGQNHQILCITHLPQIAAAGNHHFLIFKQEDDVSSSTGIRYLDAEQRREEIARLLGGANVTATTRMSADELIASFE